MRYESIKKPIPKTLEDCTKSEAASKVQTWASRTEDWGAVVCFLLVVVGLLTAFLSAGIAGKDSGSTAALTFFLSFLPWCIGAVVAHFSFRLAAVLLEALASITLNTAVSANLALYEAAQKEPPVTAEVPNKNEIPPSNLKA